MSRKGREWYPNIIMHITSRGNHRNDIFRDEEDYEFYISTIDEAIQYFNGEFEILSYALMTNHIHLQIQTKEKHIGFFMKRINNFYARYFNNKYNYTGHLFQERYGSEIVVDDKYMLEVSRYIHLNPIRANMVEKPEDYKWSSYSMYIGKKKEKLVTTKKVLSYFKKGNERELYKKFIESAIRTKISS